MNKTEQIEFVDAGVDWITVTAKEPRKVDALRKQAYTLIDSELRRGMFGGPWFQSGYVGVACGHVQYGERQDGCILRLGGSVAKTYWRFLLQNADNVTRIDMQVTVRSKQKPALVVHNHYRQIQRSRRLFKRAPRLSRICDDDGGYTVYTGRRSSNVMGRIYDKESESKMDQYKGCVRYEVQFNGRRARWVAHTTNSGSYDLADISRAVLEFFRTRGALIRRLLEFVSSSLFIKTSQPPEKPTDITRKLEWLLHSVKPSVRHLIELGLRERVLAVLGINIGPGGPCTASG